METGRVMIAAPRSGSGKTIITCGLLRYLKDAGFNVRSYKCGPDYIDPMFHRNVIGVPGGNLDTFFSGRDELREIIAAGCRDHMAVIEGVMGIYDGITGMSGKGSCYDAAYASGTPVILIADVRGMGQTMLSVIRGIIADDKEHLIRGIILNRISGGYFREIRPLMERMLKEMSEGRAEDIILLGGIPPAGEIRLTSRHLGLVMPDETENLQAQVDAARDLLADNVDMDALLGIMRQAEEIPIRRKDDEASGDLRITADSGECVTIAVARDEAFCFYYEENLRMLEKCGIRIIEFSPLHDEELPAEADGILLGGGYPELYAAALSAGKSMRSSVKRAVMAGMPCLAECGGFMYLLDELATDDGKRHPMCGVIRGSSSNTGRLGRFGYITVSPDDSDKDTSGESLLSGILIRGHEFHYYDSDNNGTDALAVKPGSGRSWKCMHAEGNILAGYPHLYYPSCPELVLRFRERMKAFNRNKHMTLERGN